MCKNVEHLYIITESRALPEVATAGHIQKELYCSCLTQKADNTIHPKSSLCNNLVPAYTRKISLLMVRRGSFVPCCENQTNPIKRVCGRHGQSPKVEADGGYTHL